MQTKRRCDDKEFAVKIIKFESNAEYAGKYRREAKMLSLLDHNNIVRYYNSWIETAKISRSEYEDLKSDSENSLSSEIDNLSKNGYIAETNQDGDDCQNEENDEKTELSHENVELNYLFIQMELCDKRTLRTAIIDDLYLEETRVAKYFKEICEGLLHMHNMHIVHRDLKPENIFLTSGDVIKIGDFAEEIFGSLTDVCGTNVYIAPELIGLAHYAAKNNITKLRRYSVGKTFEEGYFLPSETQECVFEAISSESDDYVNDAEILYIAKEICDGVLKSEMGEICFFINHRSIFSTILRHCKIADNNATVFTNMMIEFSKYENIYLSPLLMNEKIYSSMMFKAELKEKAVIATGGRFDSLIKQCMRQNRAVLMMKLDLFLVLSFMLKKKQLRFLKVNDEAAGCSSKNVTRLEQDFILGESLGYGGFGQIVKTLSSEICKLSENGYISNKSAVDRDYDEDDEMEDDEEDSWISFEADSKQVKYLLIQMELCEKRTLRTAIDSGLYLEEAKITKYFREICEELLSLIMCKKIKSKSYGGTLWEKFLMKATFFQQKHKNVSSKPSVVSQ
ncbi:Pkinase domain containing protein, partial [Asbolus verrucosus]